MDVRIGNRTIRPRLWLGAGLLLVLLGAGAGVAQQVGPRAGPRDVLAGAFAHIGVDAGAGRTFVVNTDETTVSVLDSRSGRLLATVPAGGDVDGLAVDARRHRVFVTTRAEFSRASGAVTVLDARTASVLTAFTVGADPDVVAVDGQSGRAFAGSGDASVTVLDPASGAEHDPTWLGLGLSSLGVDARSGHVFAANGIARTVSMLDGRTGALLRTIPLRRSPGDMAVDARTGRAFVVNSDADSISVIDTRAGRLLRTVAVAANPTAVAVDERTDQVFVTSWGAMDSDDNPLGPGTVSVLDARSGSIVGTFAAGTAPAAIAVDERSRQLFIVNTGGTVPGHDTWTWLPPWLRRWLPFLPRQEPRTVSGSVTMQAIPGG